MKKFSLALALAVALGTAALPVAMLLSVPYDITVEQSQNVFAFSVITSLCIVAVLHAIAND